MLFNPKEIDLQVDPIVAWKFVRLFTRLEGDPIPRVTIGLEGTYSSQELEIGLDTAICLKAGRFTDDDHSTPDPLGECACGFNAYKRVEDAIIASNDYRGVRTVDINLVILQVELFGRVVEYEEGYRAEKQRIVAVYLDLDSPYTPSEVRQALAVDAAYVNELEVNLIFHPDRGWVSYAQYFNAEKDVSLCEVCLDPTDVTSHRNVRCSRHNIKEMYVGGYETSHLVYNRMFDQLVTGEELVEFDKEKNLCQVCLEIVNLGYRCDKHSLPLLCEGEYEYEVVPGHVLSYGKFVPGRRFIKKDTRQDICEVCLSPSERKAGSRRCCRHSVNNLYGITHKGEDTDYELRVDKRGKPYVYKGYQVHFDEFQTGMRSLLVFHNEKSNTYTISIAWQTRVDAGKGLVYPVRIERWIYKRNWLYKSVRGKLQQQFPYTRTSEKKIYDAISTAQALFRSQAF